MRTQVDIMVGELEPGYRALVEPMEVRSAGEGPYRTASIEPLAAEYFPSGGRLGVFTGCTSLGAAMLLIGGASLVFVLAPAAKALVIIILALLAFGGMVAAGIGLWAFAIREVLRTRAASRQRQGVFLARDALMVSEGQRCSLLPWSCVERVTAFSAAHETTDYVVLAYCENDGAVPRTLRIRVPWRKGKLLRRIRRRVTKARSVRVA